MTITEATTFFETLLNETENKNQIKIYSEFIAILVNLKSRDLSEEDLLSIENEIKNMGLNAIPEKKRQFFSKKLNAFKAYLKEKFALVSEGYYMSIGMALGMCFGVAIGASFGALGISMGVSLGMIVGLTIGRTKDQEAEKQNRVLKTKMN